jgi:hypothetical protein
MRITAEMAIFALLALPCHPEGQQDTKQSLIVYVNLGAEVPGATLEKAELLASRMFEKAGVSLHWHRGRPKAHDMEQSMTVGITSNTPGTLQPGALAYAEVYAGQLEGVHIRIFFDRIESSGTSKLVPYLLGHVLVHEITHILENRGHLSDEGVMKRCWTTDDLYQMLYRPLPFAPLDMELIRRGLADRDRAATSARRGKRGIAEVAPTQ